MTDNDSSADVHEYVVSITDRQACALQYITHERVIRCRDCGSYDPIIHSCGRIDIAAKAFVSYVFDDDFCAWGEAGEQS